MFTATLRCSRVLNYEARTFLPEVGDLVPCCRHGYCAVEGIDPRGGTGAHGRSFARAAPRSRNELLEWLRQRPVASVSALRRQRFTLRIIAEAERDGLLELDLRAGRVALRAGSQACERAGGGRDTRS
jgi:hypothetical protein